MRIGRWGRIVLSCKEGTGKEGGEGWEASIRIATRADSCLDSKMVSTVTMIDMGLLRIA